MRSLIDQALAEGLVTPEVRNRLLDACSQRGRALINGRI